MATVVEEPAVVFSKAPPRSSAFELRDHSGIHYPCMKTMRIVNRFIILLPFLVMVVMPCAGDVCVYKPPTVRHVAGTVVDSSGQPIPGVTVEITRAGTPVASTTTSDSGSFKFDKLEEGA